MSYKCADCGRRVAKKGDLRNYQGRRICFRCRMAHSRSKNGTQSPTVAGRANKGGKQSGANDVDKNSKGRAPSIADGADGGTSGEGGILESIELSPSMWDGGRAIQWLEAYKRDLEMQ